MKTISNVVLKPQSEVERIATERILTNRCLMYEGPGEWFEVYESLTPQDWAEILEEVDRETAVIELAEE